MNSGIIFGIIMLYCCYNVTAQKTTIDNGEEDYRNFREIFSKEFKDHDTSSQVSRISVHPASLADWLSNIPESDKNTVYAIGISDPGMVEDEAIELAMLRAKIITALLIQSHISSITDNYSNEGNRSSNQFVTKYANYYRLQAALKEEDEQFKLVNNFFTSFNEAVVLVKYDMLVPASDNVDSVLLKIDVYHSERQQRNTFELEEKCEVYGLSKQNNSNEEINIFYYFFHSVNQFYEIVSRYNGEELNFPPSIFRYQSLVNPNLSSNINEITYKLTNGLWKAYLQSMIQSYTQSVECPDIEIGQVNDNYNSSTQNLSRELATTTPNYRIKGVRVNNNRLSVILKKNEVNH